MTLDELPLRPPLAPLLATLAARRLAQLGDLHEPVLRERQRLPARLLRGG